MRTICLSLMFLFIFACSGGEEEQPDVTPQKEVPTSNKDTEDKDTGTKDDDTSDTSETDDDTGDDEGSETDDDMSPDDTDDNDSGEDDDDTDDDSSSDDGEDDEEESADDDDDDEDDDSNDNDDDEDESEDVTCSADEYTIEIPPINMLIVMDRSASMALQEGTTYEESLDEALSDLVTDEANELVYFGLTAFPSEDCLKEGASRFDQVCQPADEMYVDIGPDTGDDIADVLKDLDTCGGTPICDSLKYAKEQIDDLDDELSDNRTFILLATDGAPNCSSDLDIEDCVNTNPDSDVALEDSTQCLDDACSIDATKELFEDDIETFVVGVGDDITEFRATMNSIAEAGSDGEREAYEAGDKESLSSTFRTIIRSAIPCHYVVPWDKIKGERGSVKACDKVAVKEPAPEDEDDIPEGVEVDDNGLIELPFSPECENEEGWHWAGDPDDLDYETPLEECQEIRFCDGACKRLRDGDLEDVTFWFGCKPVVLI